MGSTVRSSKYFLRLSALEVETYLESSAVVVAVGERGLETSCAGVSLVEPAKTKGANQANATPPINKLTKTRDRDRLFIIG